MVGMNYKVTVRTLTGAVKTVEVKEMPNEEAAAAEAIAMTFGRVLNVELIGSKPQTKPKKKERKQVIEKKLKPGETETIITGYNNNPLAVFSHVDITF